MAIGRALTCADLMFIGRSRMLSNLDTSTFAPGVSMALATYKSFF
jgi:hypothetical protein